MTRPGREALRAGSAEAVRLQVRSPTFPWRIKNARPRGPLLSHQPGADRARRPPRPRPARAPGRAHATAAAGRRARRAAGRSAAATVGDDNGPASARPTQPRPRRAPGGTRSPRPHLPRPRPAVRRSHAGAPSRSPGPRRRRRLARLAHLDADRLRQATSAAGAPAQACRRAARTLEPPAHGHPRTEPPASSHAPRTEASAAAPPGRLFLRGAAPAGQLRPRAGQVARLRPRPHSAPRPRSARRSGLGPRRPRSPRRVDLVDQARAPSPRRPACPSPCPPGQATVSLHATRPRHRAHGLGRLSTPGGHRRGARTLGARPSPRASRDRTLVRRLEPGRAPARRTSARCTPVRSARAASSRPRRAAWASCAPRPGPSRRPPARAEASASADAAPSLGGAARPQRLPAARLSSTRARRARRLTPRAARRHALQASPAPPRPRAGRAGASARRPAAARAPRPRRRRSASRHASATTGRVGAGSSLRPSTTAPSSASRPPARPPVGAGPRRPDRAQRLGLGAQAAASATPADSARRAAAATGPRHRADAVRRPAGRDRASSRAGGASSRAGASPGPRPLAFTTAHDRAPDDPRRTARAGLVATRGAGPRTGGVGLRQEHRAGRRRRRSTTIAGPPRPHRLAHDRLDHAVLVERLRGGPASAPPCRTAGGQSQRHALAKVHRLAVEQPSVAGSFGAGAPACGRSARGRIASSGESCRAVCAIITTTHHDRSTISLVVQRTGGAAERHAVHGLLGVRERHGEGRRPGAVERLAQAADAQVRRPCSSERRGRHALAAPRPPAPQGVRVAGLDARRAGPARTPRGPGRRRPGQTRPRAGSYAPGSSPRHQRHVDRPAQACSGSAADGRRPHSCRRAVSATATSGVGFPGWSRGAQRAPRRRARAATRPAPAPVHVAEHQVVEVGRDHRRATT